LLFHHFLASLESRSRELSYPSRLLVSVLGPQVSTALCQAGVLRPSGLATWYTCAREDRECRRTVAADGLELHLVCGQPLRSCPTEIAPAVWYPCPRLLPGCRRALRVDGPELHLSCGQPSGDCKTEIVPSAELGQHALDEDALVKLLQHLFGVEAHRPRTDGRRRATWLGCLPGGHRDVWLWLRPREPAFSTWMGAAEARSRESGHWAFVLVPTGKHVPAHTFERYGRGRPVEIVYLDRVLALEAGEIVLAEAPVDSTPAPRVPGKPGPLVERPGVRIHVPAGLRWSHIAIEYVNDTTLCVRIGTYPPQRLTPPDLSLKLEVGGDHTVLWQLLLALCAGNGVCSSGAAHSSTLYVLRKRTSRLARRLRRAFGMDDLPLHVDGRSLTVRADFIARPETLRASTRRDRDP
jgi:hypothetical protein